MACSQSYPEQISERCSLHEEKVLEFYCKKHDDVGCSDCIETNHKSCQSSSIPDRIDSLIKLVDVEGLKKELNRIMNSIKSLKKSCNENLNKLEEAKCEAKEQVNKLEKELISIIKESATESKSEIDKKFQELEKEIEQDKCNIVAVNKELEQSKGKLKESDGNNAQTFVCSKQAEKQLKKADRLMSNPNNRSRIHLLLSFSPNQSMKNYVQGLHGIGQVCVRRKKLHLYRIKRQRNINIKLPDDSEKCSSSGCCLTQDNKLLITDNNNKKLKRINLVTMIVEDSCKLDGNPCGVCCISDKQVAVACWNPGSIQFVSIDQKMSPTRLIKLSHDCNGIAFNDNKLYVTDKYHSLYVRKMDVTLIKTITCDSTERKLFSQIKHVTFNENRNKMLVADAENGIICLDKHGNYLKTVSDIDLKWAIGVCVDGNDCVFVTGNHSHNVIQYNEDGKKMGVIIKQQDGLNKPRAVCFDQKLNRLFVTMQDSEGVKMYELE